MDLLNQLKECWIVWLAFRAGATAIVIRPIVETIKLQHPTRRDP